MGHECPLCRNNSYKWDLLEKADNFFLHDGKVITGEMQTLCCLSCGFVIRVFKRKED